MQPGHSQDYLLSTQTEDHKVGTFSGVREEDICVGFSFDGSFDIGCSVHIVCSNRLGETL